MKFWAGLDSWGCRGKKPPNCHKYATFWGCFSTFCGQKLLSIKAKKILKKIGFGLKFAILK